MSFEIRVIPHVRATTFKQQKVWATPEDPLRRRYLDDESLVGCAIPIDPFAHPEWLPSSIVAFLGGRAAILPPMDTGPWNVGDPFWLRGRAGLRPRAERSFSLFERLKSHLPAWIERLVLDDPGAEGKFEGREEELSRALAVAAMGSGIRVTPDDLLDDRKRIPYGVPKPAGLDISPGGWNLLGVEGTYEDLLNFSAILDAVAFAVPEGGIVGV